MIKNLENCAIFLLNEAALLLNYNIQKNYLQEDPEVNKFYIISSSSSLVFFMCGYFSTSCFTLQKLYNYDINCKVIKSDQRKAKNLYGI